jgi:DNA-binding GntR family transcriptional regulator
MNAEANDWRQAQVAYRRLKDGIIDGGFAPGSSVKEPALAAHLGMSRTPVREALVRLAHEGYVDLVPRRGMRVRALTKRDIREISELLACLECEAAERLAARRLAPEELRRLDAAIADMDRALESDDRAAWSGADYRFHHLLVELCGNRHLIEVATQLLEKAHRYRVLTRDARAKPVYSNVNHAAVVEAIRRGDAQTALEIHRAHKRRWMRELDGLLDRLAVPD